MEQAEQRPPNRARRPMGKIAGRAFAAVTLALACLPAVYANDFPSKPITVMVGLAPGGITDVTARLYAEVVARNSGQRITIENRPAAAGALAAAAVQNAVPDGTMLLVFSGSQHATVAAMGSAPYEPVKGFSFITVLFNSVVAFVVPPDSPARTLEELFDGANDRGDCRWARRDWGRPRISWARGSRWRPTHRCNRSITAAARRCWPTCSRDESTSRW